MSNSENFHPSFFAIIPAHVRYSQEIEPAAKLLYGELTALTSIEGYCWAQNKYFADLYNVSERQVKNWINSLKKSKFIFVEVIKDETGTHRRIWLSSEIQKNFRAEKNFPPVGKKFPAGVKKISPILIHLVTHLVTQQEKRGEGDSALPPPQTPNPPPLVLVLGNVRIEEQKLKELVDKYGKEIVEDYVERLSDYSQTNPKKFKLYACHAAVLRTWLKRDGVPQVRLSKADPCP